MANSVRSGGYDEGYAHCPCFWGNEPGSLVKTFATRHPNLTGYKVLDVGTGEGKNAGYLESLGAAVLAVDISALAITSAKTQWSVARRVTWVQADIADLTLEPASFDLVIVYGLFHCLSSKPEIEAIARKLQDATVPGGSHIVCSFNRREQDLSAHPGFYPTLIEHREYLELYSGWAVSCASDLNLHEVHPHNGIPHTHSMTRFIAEQMK